MATFLRDPTTVCDAVTAAGVSVDALRAIIARASEVASEYRNTEPAAALVHRVDVHDDRVDLTLCIDALLPAGSLVNGPVLHCLSVAMARILRGHDARITIGGDMAPAAPADQALLKLLAAARTAWQAMLAADETPLAEVAKVHGYLPEQFTMLLRLATLAPCIVTAIVEGRQPASLNRQRLATITNLPRDWAGQRIALGV